MSSKSLIASTGLHSKPTGSNTTGALGFPQQNGKHRHMPTEYKQNQLKSSVGHPIHPHFARWGHSVGKGLLSVVVRLAMTSESMGSHYNAKYAKVLTPKTTLINNPPCFAHTKPTKMRTIISVTVGNTSYTFWPPTATNNFF